MSVSQPGEARNGQWRDMEEPGDRAPHGSPHCLVPSLPRHDVEEVAGLTSFSFGEDDDCRYVMIFKKEFAPSDEELDSTIMERSGTPRRSRRNGS